MIAKFLMVAVLLLFCTGCTEAQEVERVSVVFPSTIGATIITVDLEEGTKQVRSPEGQYSTAFSSTKELQEFVQGTVLRSKSQPIDSDKPIAWRVQVWTRDGSQQVCGQSDFPEYWEELLHLLDVE